MLAASAAVGPPGHTHTRQTGRLTNIVRWLAAFPSPTPPGADFHGAPDLDHANPELREALCHWLQWLHKDIGFEGWRFDFVKGFGAE